MGRGKSILAADAPIVQTDTLGKKYRVPPGRKSRLSDLQKERLMEFGLKGTYGLTELCESMGIAQHQAWYFLESKGVLVKTKLPKEKRSRARWTDAEDEIIRKSGHLSNCAIQKKLKKAGFQRTYAAVKGRRSSISPFRDGWYSRCELASILKVNVTKIYSLEKRGILKFKDFGADARGELISERNLARALWEHVSEFDHRRIDPYWLRDMWCMGIPTSKRER